MPSKTAVQVFLDLYFVLDGAPWNYRRWQQVTGIYHGLFPESDRELPLGWTRRNAQDVYSFFLAYHRISDSKEQEKFIKNSPMPGRVFFQKWVTASWPKWNIHDLVCAALRERECHPFQLLRNDNTIETFPSSQYHISKVNDDIGMRLLGPDAFRHNSRTLPSIYNDLAFPSAFIQRSWVRLKQKLERDKTRLVTLGEEATAAYEEVSSLPKPTKTALTKVIKTVAKWKDLLDIYDTDEHIDKVESMMASLNKLLEEVGVKVTKNQRKSSASSAQSKPRKAILATQQDVDELANLYEDLFAQDFDDEHALSFDPDDPDSNTQDGNAGDADAIGIDAVGTLDEPVVHGLLGLVDGQEPLFNSLRHKGGLTTWDNPEEFTPDSIEPNLCHLHQHNGALATLYSTTTTDPETKPVTSSMLIADEVGLGKTRLLAKIIAMFIRVVVSIERNIQLPPVLKDRFLEGGQEFESLPHLWITPMTLIPQSIHALMVCFQAHSIDIMVYECGKRGNAAFWSKTGPFATSKHPLHQRIIMISHSSLREEFSYCHGPIPKKTDTPWTLPPTADRGLKNTIFGRRFATVIIDEAHEFRRPGPKFLSAFLACRRGQLRLLATGTPLHTNTNDILALGRLMGLPYFMSKEGLQEANSDASTLFKSRPSSQDTDRDDFMRLQVTITRKYQAHMIGNMLRRTAKTLDYRGQQLLPDLPPKMKIPLIVTQTEREQEATAAVARNAKANANAANESGIVATRFYLDYRLTSCYAKADPDGPNPKFNSLDEWEPVKSTKMDVAARVAAHYLSHDEIDDVSCERGEAIYPAMPFVPASESPPRNRKVLISVAFPSLMPIFLDVLRLYGIDYLYIDGQTPLEKRARIINQFLDPDGPRVLVFSSVGAIGLNLTIADIVIFLDQPWSSQDEKQIEARAHRQPQDKIVRCIHILAKDTADCVMSMIAKQKSLMHDAFANKTITDEIADLLKGKTVYGPDDADFDVSDEEDLSETPAKPIHRQTASAKGKEKAKQAPPIKVNVRPKENVKQQSATTGSSKRKGKTVAQELINEEDDHISVGAVKKVKVSKSSNALKRKSGEPILANPSAAKRVRELSKVRRRATAMDRMSSRIAAGEDEHASDSEISVEYDQNASPPTPVISSSEGRSHVHIHKLNPTALRESWRTPSKPPADSSDGDMDLGLEDSDNDLFSEEQVDLDTHPTGRSYATDEDEGRSSDGGTNLARMFITPTQQTKKKKLVPPPRLGNDEDFNMAPPAAPPAKQKSRSKHDQTRDDNGDVEMALPNTQSKPLVKAKATQRNDSQLGSTRPPTSPTEERPSKRARAGSLTVRSSGLAKKSSEPVLSGKKRDEKKGAAQLTHPSTSARGNLSSVPSVDFSKMHKLMAISAQSGPRTVTSASSSSSVSRVPSLDFSETPKPSTSARPSVRSASAIEKEAYRRAEISLALLRQRALEPTPSISPEDTLSAEQPKGRPNPFARKPDGSRTTAPGVKKSDGSRTTTSEVKKSNEGRMTAPAVKMTYSRLENTKNTQPSSTAQAQRKGSSLANLATRRASTTLPETTATVRVASGSSHRDLPQTQERQQASHNKASSLRNEGRSSHRRPQLWLEEDDDDDNENDSPLARINNWA
ncbi:hypothetical protein AAF712_015368 [Marasmius tenuissimus]|uniref:Helicase C-terminal domain-containing protein n=1 Tax=Marasmius tenuissimus TaxID=585030 RepID=A0ABR2ZAK1_9AGAR